MLCWMAASSGSAFRKIFKGYASNPTMANILPPTFKTMGEGPQGYSSVAPANASRVDVNSDKFIELFSEPQMTYIAQIL